ncbi:MAG TPA: hypothetical protein VF989_02745, partial [Polyangiaceae bacterium]
MAAAKTVSPGRLKRGVPARSGRRHKLRVRGDLSFTLPAQFASGAESLKLQYEIKGLATEEVKLRVESDKYAGKKVFERKLTAAERVDGKRTLSWNGKGNKAGVLSGKFVDPAHSPYRVILEAVGGKLVQKSTAVKVAELKVLKPTATQIFMNNPNSIVNVEAQVLLLDSAGAKKATACPIKVRFTFADPGNNNATKAASFAHAPPARLGKRSDASAVFWKKSAGTVATSSDGFKTQCDVTTLAAGADRGKAKVV